MQTNPEEEAEITKDQAQSGTERGGGALISGCPGLMMSRNISEEKALEMAIACLVGYEVKGSEPGPPWPLPSPLNHQQKCATCMQKKATASVCSIQDKQVAYDQWWRAPML